MNRTEDNESLVILKNSNHKHVTLKHKISKLCSQVSMLSEFNLRLVEVFVCNQSKNEKLSID